MKEIQSLREKSVDTKEEIKNRRKNLVETCKVHRFLKELPNVIMLIEVKNQLFFFKKIFKQKNVLGHRKRGNGNGGNIFSL